MSTPLASCCCIIVDASNLRYSGLQNATISELGNFIDTHRTWPPDACVKFDQLTNNYNASGATHGTDVIADMHDCVVHTKPIPEMDLTMARVAPDAQRNRAC
jgi:hypothetical protein